MLFGAMNKLARLAHPGSGGNTPISAVRQFVHGGGSPAGLPYAAVRGFSPNGIHPNGGFNAAIVRNSDQFMGRQFRPPAYYQHYQDQGGQSDYMRRLMMLFNQGRFFR